ncbi:unnamed protein product, partial [Closterium sp. NIES-65]
LSDSGITDSRPAEQTISGNENRSSLPLKDGKNPLPEKALCEILDKLQKKDLYGVFSVPVNPAEVPDYFDVISHPMDFSTVRGRVAKKLYTSWRQFEDDVSLIWKNAMIYNAEGTIYYKQAKAMQGMAQKIFPAAGSNEIYPRSGFGRGFRGRGRGRGQPGRPKRIPLSDPAQKDTQSGRRFLGQRKDAVPLVDDKQDRLVFGMDERSEVSLSEDIAQTKPAQRILGKGMEKGELLNSQSQPKSSYLGGDDSGNKVSRLKNYKVCRRATSPSGGKHLSFRSWRHLARFASPLGSLVWEVAAEKVKQTLPSEVPFGRGWIGLDDPLQSLQSLNHEGESARRVLKGQKEGVPDVSVDDVKQASKQPVRTAAKTSARPAKGLRKSASPHPGSLTKLQVCSEAAAAAPIETAHSKSVSDGAPVSSTSESVHGPKDIDRSSGMLHMPHWFNGASRPGAGFSSPPPTAAVVSPISAQEALSGPRGVSTGSPSEAGSLSLSNAAIQTLLNSCAGAADHVDRSSVLAMRASAVAALQAANSARQGQSVLSAQALQSLMHAPQGSADVETPTKPLGSALMGALNALWSQNASTSSPGAPAITAAAFGKQGLNSLHRLGGLSSPVRAGSTSSSDPGDKNAADHLNKMVEGHHAVFSQNGLKNSPLWAALEAGKIDGLLGSPLNSSKGASVGDGSGAQAVATSNQAAQALAASVSKGSWPGGLPGNAWLAEFSSQQQQAANATAYGSLNALTPATLADVLQQQQGTNPSTSSLRPGSSSAARSMMAALDKLKAHHGLHSNSAGSSFSSAAFSAAAAAASNHASASASAGLPVADGSMAAATAQPPASSGQNEDAGPWTVSNDYPEDYVLVSTDPEDLEATLRRIAEENEILKKRVEEATAAATAQAVQVAGERKAGVDVTRPRAGAVAPSAPPPDVAAVIAASSASPATAGAPAVAPPPPSPSPAAPAEEKTMPVAASAESPGDAATASQRNAELERDRESAKHTAEGSDGPIKKTENPISIVFVASEVAPYSKTGGLADVTGSLPLALAARGHRVMVVAPRYMNGVTDKLYAGAFDCQCRIKCFLFEGEHEVAFFHEFRDGVDFVFVDHPSYHRPGTPYGDSRGAFGDNQFRFALLCHAACEAPLVLPFGGFTYGEKVVFVANDWHAGLVPVLVASKYRRYGVYKDARTIIAIHNLAHQGVEPAYTFGSLGVPGEWYGALEWVFPEWARKHALDKGEAVNILKGAIVTADRVLTVSQGYAWEITTGEGGWGLDGLLRGRSIVLNGVTNGIDTVDWNPATDKHIPSQFTAEDLEGKAECKAALQKELGLAVRPEVPLIGFIGRLDWQKGPDVIQAALPELMTDNVQFVMLGSGEPDLEAWMKWAESAYPDKFRGWVGFSVPMAHRITAGCDILLMPSRFEPCGLNQLYAMRYGTVPVVHATGGLRDTVEDFNPFANGGAGAGTGWSFSPLTQEAMMGALWTAIQTYREHKDSWQGLIQRGMTQDMSWNRAAQQYEQIFEWAVKDKPYA